MALSTFAGLEIVHEPEFTPFPKLARWNREIVVTEKIDGTNAAVVVSEDLTTVHAQSRKRVVTPGQDNFGFAAWVAEHEEELATGLGAGTHFGEWWGLGIQRGYGLEEKRFSLFNSARWGNGCTPPDCCYVVPQLGIYDYPAEGFLVNLLDRLRDSGSQAAPGFMKPEGVVIFHAAARQMFKITLENDEKPKGQVA